MHIPLRWGGDWNFNGKTAGLVDLPHYELHPWREWAKKSKLFGG
jgi:peptidoglycan L-alanyl-D-glutamate endopeptidase CwlK